VARSCRPVWRCSAVLQGSSAFWAGRDFWLLAASLLLLAVIPFTLVFILPTNKRLLDPALPASPSRAVTLLTRWGRLHAVRSALGTAAFLVFLWRSAND
jgi:anthrone oxygenase-like protein